MFAGGTVFEALPSILDNAYVARATVLLMLSVDTLRPNENHHTQAERAPYSPMKTQGRVDRRGLTLV